MNLQPVKDCSDAVVCLEKAEVEILAVPGGIVDQALQMCSQPQSLGYLMTPKSAGMLLTFEHMTAICKVVPLNALEEKFVRILASHLAKIENIANGDRTTLTFGAEGAA